jgi:crotonobetainyl-CoA:carnitine CoA-transferase CaiB-like acyl-CoA transferase
MANFLGTVPNPPEASPALGQHVTEILDGLGFSKEEVDAWRNNGVIG